MDNVKFKRLEIEDVRSMYEILEGDNILYNEENIKCFIQDKNNYDFIGITSNKVIAFLYGYGMLRPDGRKMFYIHSVDVLSGYQSNGVGTKLLEYTLNYIKQEKSFYKFFILTDSDNVKACKLYQKYSQSKEQILFSNEI